MTEKRRTPPSWIDRDFIQTSLRIGYNDPEISVKSISVRPAIAVGDNYGSDMFRASAELEGANSVSVIIKIIPRGIDDEVLMNACIFDREAEMFTEILVKMFHLLEESAPGQYQPFSAKCLHYGLKPLTFLVLEDLSTPGFKVAQRHDRLDLAHSQLVMKNLALLHASSVALQLKEPKLFEPHKESTYSGAVSEMVKKFMTGSVRSLAEELEKHPECETYVEKLRKFSDSLFDRMLDATSYKEGRFNVLIHGDPWVNNIMFKYSEGDVMDLRFVDFQLTSLATPAFDIHYFLNTSTNDEVHTKHRHQLLVEYHSTLNNTLCVLGYKDRTISLEQLLEELDEYIVFALYAVVSVLPITIADQKAGEDIARAIENIVDGEYPAPKSIYANERYLSIVKRMLPELEAKGSFKEV